LQPGAAVSHSDGVGEYLFPHPRPEALIGHNVDLPVEELAQCHQQATQIEEAAAYLQVYQEVDITPVVAVGACRGAEHPYISSFVLGRQPQDLFPS